MLPVTFKFSQSSLQDYVDCPRRFQLRYVESQAWPAVQAEPFLEREQHLERGARFHRLAQRHQLGLNPDVLATAVQDDTDLAAWWQAYLGFDFVHTLEGRRYPEFTLSTDLAGSRLMAMFDLLVVTPGEHVWIFDWKTYQHPPSGDRLARRLQSQVYPYVLAQAGESLFGGALQPDQITMVYWIVSAPSDPVFLPYSNERFAAESEYLASLITGIKSLSEPNSPSNQKMIWSLTPDIKKCEFCEYRSLCNRGESAGFDGEFGEDTEEDINAFTPLGLADVEEVGF